MLRRIAGESSRRAHRHPAILQPLLPLFLLLVSPTTFAADPPLRLSSSDEFASHANLEGLALIENDELHREAVSSGTVGAWAATTSFPTPRQNFGLASHKGFLYLVAGWEGSLDLDDVRYAQLLPDGSLNQWMATTSLPAPVSTHATVIYNGYVYVIGGSRDQGWLDPPLVLDEVLYAPIQENGSVGAWSATAALPIGRWGHAAVTYNGYLYVMGGSDDVQCLNDVLYAPLNADGSVGAWQATTSFAASRYAHS